MSRIESLAMTVARAVELYQKSKEIMRKLQAMDDVGLAYLTLGQPLGTVSAANASTSSLPASRSATESLTGRYLGLDAESVNIIPTSASSATR
jgi:hypothetical protein